MGITMSEELTAIMLELQTIERLGLPFALCHRDQMACRAAVRKENEKLAALVARLRTFVEHGEIEDGQL